MNNKGIKVLIGKPGLDGHDTGAKAVCKALQEAGMDVVYSGLHRTPEDIVEMALKEKADVIGLSILSGAHLSIAQKLMATLKEKGISNIPVVIGGVIPRQDIPKLKEYGIAEVCPFSTKLDEAVEVVSRLAKTERAV